MSMASTLEDYLAQRHTRFDMITHPRSDCSGETARMTHISGKRIAKAVVLADERGYLMAVVPANRHIHLGQLYRHLARRLGLATESELGVLFRDCAPGAIPPLGQAYGMETLLDQDLLDGGDIYFEAGDHQSLVHLSGEQFRRLSAGLAVAPLSRLH